MTLKINVVIILECVLFALRYALTPFALIYCYKPNPPIFTCFYLEYTRGT